jgi:hypothetical protein
VAYSATGSPVVASVAGGNTTTVRFNLKDADAVVLTRRPGAMQGILSAARASSPHCGCKIAARRTDAVGWLAIAASGVAGLARGSGRRFRRRGLGARQRRVTTLRRSEMKREDRPSSQRRGSRIVG